MYILGPFQKLICCLLLGLLLCSACTSQKHTENVEDPNIILIMADDMGYGDPAFIGNKIAVTPTLDEMSQNGLTFSRFYAGAPVCSPTRASVLTGRHPYRMGIYSPNVGHLPQEEITVAELVKKKGYRTGHFGKWHLGTMTKTEDDGRRGGPENAEHYSPPWKNGFDVTFSAEAGLPLWDPYKKPKDLDLSNPDYIKEYSKNPWWDPIKDPDESNYFGMAFWNEKGEKVDKNIEGATSRVLMDRVIPFIENSTENDTPFLAVLWFHTPHIPLVTGKKYRELYSDHSKIVQHYFGSITAMDEQIGRLRDELKKLGAKDNTLIWFKSDNGPARKDTRPGTAGPLRGDKGSLYEGGIRVPGIIEWPSAIRQNRHTDLPVSTSDILPTIMDLLEIEGKEKLDLDGESVLDLLLDEQEYSREKPLYFKYGSQSAIIDKHLKLYSNNDEEWELYNLDKDIGENNDISDQNSDEVERLKNLYQKFEDSIEYEN